MRKKTLKYSEKKSVLKIKNAKKKMCITKNHSQCGKMVVLNNSTSFRVHGLDLRSGPGWESS
jgi:hypothetical protein